MDFDQLKETLRTELPLNRKEKFYTGTILPALLLHNGFSNLYQFLHAIPGFPAQINEQNTKDNLLLYTEYNLKESAGKKNVGIEIETDRRDTPDAIIEIITPLKVFVVIEAKMFANPTLSDFNSQMQDQKKTVVDTLEKAYQPHDIFHVALLPRQLGFSDTANYDVINWQFFLNNPELDLQDNYFFPYLQFALENYDKLVSRKHGKPSTVKEEHNGSQIYLDGKTAKTLWVGRMGGKEVIQNDIRKGIWRNKRYGTNTAKPKDGREGNWLSSAEFAEIVDRSYI